MVLILKTIPDNADDIKMCKGHFTGQTRRERIKVKMRTGCADPKTASEDCGMEIARLLSSMPCNGEL